MSVLVRRQKENSSRFRDGEIADFLWFSLCAHNGEKRTMTPLFGAFWKNLVLFSPLSARVVH